MNLFGLDGLPHKDRCAVVESRRLFGGEVPHTAPLRYAHFHLGMAVEIVGQAVRHIASLRQKPYGGGKMLANLGKKQGIMRAAEDNSVYLRVAFQQTVKMLFDEIVCPGRAVFVVLHQRDPHRTGFARNLDVRPELGYLQLVGLAADGSWRGHDTDVSALRKMPHALGRGTNDTQDTARGVEKGKVVLLNAAQGLGRSRIAGQDNQVASHGKKLAHTLQGKLIDTFEGTAAVWSTGIVAQIKIVVLGHKASDFPKHREATVTGVEDSDRAGR